MLLAVDDDEEFADPEPPRPAEDEALVAIRRLATAVLIQAAADLLKSRDPRYWHDARRFLFEPSSHRDMVLFISGIDRPWLETRLSELRIEKPTGPAGMPGHQPRFRLATSENLRKSRQNAPGAIRGI